MKSVKRYSYVILSLFFLWVPPVLGDSGPLVFSGKTMGTTYHIKIFPGSVLIPDALDVKIRQSLDAINQSMSTFIPESEISRFNTDHTAGKPFPVSQDFHKVMQTSEYVYRLTDGAWDGTVKPLVDLWGFGVPGVTTQPPAPEKLREAIKQVGFYRIEVSEKGYLVKKSADVTLDLASIAKGYGVDRLASLLLECGIWNFLVEIGGEVFASGKKSDGSRWRIGINEPNSGAPLDRVYKAVTLKDMALATSGNYRNFFEKGGIRYSHIIDPRTGYPVSNGVVSTSVIAKTCALADALATGLMVMGPEKGIELVTRLESVECLIIVQKKDSTLQEFFSDGFFEAASD